MGAVVHNHNVEDEDLTQRTGASLVQAEKLTTQFWRGLNLAGTSNIRVRQRSPYVTRLLGVLWHNVFNLGGQRIQYCHSVLGCFFGGIEYLTAIKQ